MNDERKTTRPTLKKISAKNVLSFGPDGMDLDLRPLNVLIGPNGSGKSNLFELLNFLRAAPTNLSEPVRASGGVSEWVWRGAPDATAAVEAVVENPAGGQPIRHAISFRKSGRMFTLTDERIENERPYEGQSDAYFYYRYQDGHPAINVSEQDKKRRLRREDIKLDESILSQRKDSDLYPELNYLSEFYAGVRLYRDWDFGPASDIRLPQDDRYLQSQMGEQFHNLGVVLNRLRQSPKTKALMFDKLGDLYRGLTDFELDFKGGTVQISFTEGDFSIPASRLSDGSLRYLALLAVLLDPEPPPLIAIEEPELGLHPDLIPRMSDLLVDASRRSQLIVTTHSDILVGALSERSESVIVCQKRTGQSSMKRLQKEKLERWLKRYTLGDLWTKGQIGGVRW